MRQVLVVEDDPDLAENLRVLLDANGYRAHVARTLSAARAMMRSLPVDLLLLDRGLPDGDGAGLAAEIHRNDRWRDLPIVVLTALAEPDDAIEGFEAGANAYLPKPFDGKNLLDAVAKLLGE